MPRSWLKVVLTLLLGFQIGLLLGFLSSTLIFKVLPAQYVENGFKDRKARLDTILDRRACKREGFRESFDSRENRVQLCACWQEGGMGTGLSAVKSCWGYERRGWSELGV